MSLIPDNMGAASNFRLPPDSNGKRMNTLRHWHVEYVNGTHQPLAGDVITGNTSGFIGTVTSIHSNNTSTTGEVVIVPLDQNAGSNPSTGEDLFYNGGKIAEAGEWYAVHAQANMIVGGNDPHSPLFVDKTGSAYVRFAEGDQQMDGFGLTRNSTPTQIADYSHRYSKGDSIWSESSSGTASASHLPNESAIAMDVDTASGDRITRTTNKYHLYQAGMSQLIILTIASGDIGKDGVTRRWGYYDDENGVYFELAGTDLRVGLRSNTTGTPVDTVISQADWNGDKVDGSLGLSNLSGMDIDVSKLNVYWIDLQWLGGGRVRFGVLSPNGNRVTCHEIKNANANTGPYMTTATLPVRTEILNTGATGSPSRLKYVCGTVHTEGNLVPDRKKKTNKYDTEVVKTSVTTEVPLISFRSKALINGLANRKVTIPELLSSYVKTNPVRVRLYKSPTLTGANWTDHAYGGVQYDTTASAASGGQQLLSWVFDPGCYNTDFPSNFGYQGQNLVLDADGTQGLWYTLTVESLEAGGSDIDLSISLIDMGG